MLPTLSSCCMLEQSHWVCMYQAHRNIQRHGDTSQKCLEKYITGMLEAEGSGAYTPLDFGPVLTSGPIFCPHVTARPPPKFSDFAASLH